MTDDQLKALMAAVLFPTAVSWTKNSTITPEEKAIELAEGILDKLDELEHEIPDAGEGQ